MSVTEVSAPESLSLINPLDPLALRSQFRDAVPFPSILIDNFLEASFAREVVRSYPSFAKSQELGRSFKAVNEVGKVQVTDSKVFPAPVAELNRFLSSPAFVSLMQTVSGYDELLPDEELVGGGIHQTGPRGRLDVHVDFNYIPERKLYRRLNIIIFFNEQWEESWGGRLELWDDKVQNCMHSFLPIFNRCVIFETNEISYHGVTAVTCPPDYSRKSFAGYYYTREEKPQYDPHSTIFRARPDEHMKKYVLMPMAKMRHYWRVTKGQARTIAKRALGK